MPEEQESANEGGPGKFWDGDKWIDIESLVFPSGPAGGDLTGTYPSPTLDLTKTHVWTGAQSAPTFTSPILNTHARKTGALPTVSLVSGTAHQMDATADRQLVVSVTFNPTGIATATCLVELS